MSDHPAARAADQADAYRGLRAAALTAVILGVLALAAAAFVLSYAGIHAIALEAGVSAPLARLYPLIFDAMLVVAGAAVLSLRGAGLMSRCYAWLTMLVLLAAVAGAGAVHATGTRIPDRVSAAAVAVVPWTLVLISFGLLIAMLRYAQRRRTAVSAVPRPAAAAGQLAMTAPAQLMAQPAAQPLPVSPARIEPPPRSDPPIWAGHLVESPRAAADLTGSQERGYDEDELDAYRLTYRLDDAAEPDDGAELDDRAALDDDAELTLDADPGQDDPVSDEASDRDRAEHGQADAEPGAAGDADPESAIRPLQRMWSSPTPPDS